MTPAQKREQAFRDMIAKRKGARAMAASPRDKFTA